MSTRISLTAGWLITAVSLFISLLYFSTNVTLLIRGLGFGEWYIDAADFRLTVVIQVIVAILTGCAALRWCYVSVRFARRAPFDRQGMSRLLLIVIVGFFLLIATHRWFEIIICERGGIPTECGL
jgi:hypothetical protein